MVDGAVKKMKGTLGSPVAYELPLGEHVLNMNERLGGDIRIEFLGQIACVHCGRKMKKSFSQGYCYPCSQRLARCDLCILKPELCHFAKGTCREPEWGEANCLIPHTVYLANTSGLKVGITRNVPSRWIDQGAVAALPMLTVANRLDSGRVETTLAQWVQDKTNWRTMLKGNIAPRDLEEARDDLLGRLQDHPEVAALASPCAGAAVVELSYPVLEYPEKIKSHNLEKTPVVEGTLVGIKGQYLILDNGVLNIRKYTGYSLRVD